MTSRKKNGLSLPLHPYQITTWILTIIQVVSFGINVLPSLNNSAKVNFKKIIIGLLYNFSLIIFLISGVMITITDPTDPLSIGEIDENIYKSAFCSICRFNVNITSRHCGRCNRCVNGFDHHCNFVNNCIGAKNYRWFITTIISLFINSLIVLLVSSALLLNYYLSRINHIYGNCYEIWLVLDIFLLVYSAVYLSFSGSLVIMHTYFMCKGITTLDYIILRC